VLRRVLLLTSLALLGFGGMASAKLVADPATDPIATGPSAVPPTTTVRATTTAPVATSTSVTTTAATTTRPATTTTTPKSAGTTTAAVTTTTMTTTTATPGLAESSAASALVISGHGWGHGVGMAQWGANGYARHGSDYRSILAHYYQGTTIGTHAAPAVRVLLAEGRTKVTLASDSPWKVVDAAGTSVALPAGPLQVAADLAVSGRTLTSPLTFSPSATPLRVGKAAYRGKLLVVSNGKRLQVVNSLPLESYVLGVVGREMPSNWPAAALEAQAVAARSYALADLENVVTVRAFDLYSDTRSQVYGGIAAESVPVTTAVRATARQVVLYGGRVATTYFSSSSGGRTVSAAEAWGKPIPYLVSVDDPYDTLSPYHDWGPVLMDARKAGRALKVPGQLLGLTVTPGPSGHVAQVDATSTKGDAKLTGSAVRSALELRSSWFTVGWLSLTPPAEPVAYGGSGTLTGIVRGMGPVTMEQRTATGTWQTLATVSPRADGSFAVSIQPAATTQYRLAAGLVRAAMVEVPVAPMVSASLGVGTVQGTVRPALAGASVQLQRQSGAGWTTVATGTTDVAGAFAVAAQLSPGSYRVRCAPGHGLSPGVSQPILQT
jgi:stage II sporulation protein D